MIYCKPEYMQPFKACQSCLCMMCYSFDTGCRGCPFCYPMGGIYPVKYCRHFIPNVKYKVIRDWYALNSVLDTDLFT